MLGFCKGSEASHSPTFSIQTSPPYPHGHGNGNKFTIIAHDSLSHQGACNVVKNASEADDSFCFFSPFFFSLSCFTVGFG